MLRKAKGNETVQTSQAAKVGEAADAAGAVGSPAGVGFMTYRRRKVQHSLPDLIKNHEYRDRLRAVFCLRLYLGSRVGNRTDDSVRTVVGYSHCVPEMGAGDGAEGPRFKTEADGAMDFATFIGAKGGARQAKAASPCGRSA